MSGGSGGTPSGGMGPTAQPYAPNAFGTPTQGGYRNDRMYVGSAKPGGMQPEEDQGLYPPYLPPTPTPGASPPGAPAPAPGQPQTGGQEPAPGSGQPGGDMFWKMQQWLGVPYNQTYGGQPAPFDNLHTQILNTMRMGEAGAGRFTGNAAARYGFQGGNQQWRPDATPWGQQIPQYQWNPANNFGRTGGLPSQFPQQGGMPQQGVPQGQQTPPGYGQPAPGAAPAAPNHTANFQALMAEDPSGRLANEYRTRNGETINWWQQNKNNLFGGEGQMNQFINQSSPQSSNVAPLSMEEMRRLNTMAGIRSPF